MSDFRIVTVPGSKALRVLHGPGEHRALALILPEDDGTVCLFPVAFTGLPLPLTGASQIFPDVESAAAHLGIAPEAIAA